MDGKIKIISSAPRPPSTVWNDARAEVIPFLAGTNHFASIDESMEVERVANDVAAYRAQKAEATKTIQRLLDAHAAGERVNDVFNRFGVTESNFDQLECAMDEDDGNDQVVEEISPVIHFPVHDKESDADDLLEAFAKRYADVREQARARLATAELRIRNLTATSQGLANDKRQLTTRLDDQARIVGTLETDLLTVRTERDDAKKALTALAAKSKSDLSGAREAFNSEKSAAVARTWLIAVIGFSVLVGAVFLANGFLNFLHFN